MESLFFSRHGLASGPCFPCVFALCMTGNMRERLSSDLLECVSNVWSFVYYKIVNQKRSVSESASDGGGDADKAAVSQGRKIGEAVLSISKSCCFESLQFVRYGCKSALATIDGLTTRIKGRPSLLSLLEIKVWKMSKTRSWYCPRNDCRAVTAACGSVV